MGGLQIVSSIEDVQMLEVRDPDKIAYVTQTTLSVDDTRDVIEALHERFPNIVGPNVKDICYATQNRQAALRQLTEEVELILVLGAKNSSNSNRLREIGDEMGVSTYMIDDARDVNPTWFEGVERVGITAGASAPEQLVQELIERLRELEEVDLHVLDGIKERVRFRLPKELTGADVTYGGPHHATTLPSGA